MSVDVTEANREACLCPNCPTYDECMAMEEEALYCGTAVTICELTKAGCICGGCPVFSEYGLAGTYFCEAGAVE